MLKQVPLTATLYESGSVEAVLRLGKWTREQIPKQQYMSSYVVRRIDMFSPVTELVVDRVSVFGAGGD